jgi:hypothetical protein
MSYENMYHEEEEDEEADGEAVEDQWEKVEKEKDQEVGQGRKGKFF